MSNFFKGLLLGLGLSFLFAPLEGQRLRALIMERFQQLSNSLPENAQLKTQQVIGQVAQPVNTLKQNTQQAVSQVKDTATRLSNTVQQKGSSAVDTLQQKAQDTVDTARQKAQDTASTVQQKAQNTAETAQQKAQSTIDTARQKTSDAADTAQQKTQDAVNTTQQKAQDTVDTAQQQGKSAVNTAKQAASTAKPETGEPLSTIPDLAPETREKLEAQGIQTTSQLLEQAKTREEREALAQKAGVSPRTVREFVYRADLMRLDNMGEDLAALLEEAGVNGCKDLQKRNPEHLHRKLAEVQANQRIVPTTPDLDQVTAWIAQAKRIVQEETPKRGKA